MRLLRLDTSWIKQTGSPHEMAQEESWRESLRALALEDEREDRIHSLIEGITVVANDDDEIEDELFASKPKRIPNAQREVVPNVVTTNITPVAKPEEDEVLSRFHRGFGADTDEDDDFNSNNSEEDDDFTSAGWANPSKAQEMAAKARAHARAAARKAKEQEAAREAARAAAEAEVEVLRRETEARIRSSSQSGKTSTAAAPSSDSQNASTTSSPGRSRPPPPPPLPPSQSTPATPNRPRPPPPPPLSPDAQKAELGILDRIKAALASLPSITGEVVVEVKESGGLNSGMSSISGGAGGVVISSEMSPSSARASAALAQAFALSGRSGVARMQRTRPPSVVSLLSTTFAYLDSEKLGAVRKTDVRNFFNLVCARTLAELRDAKAAGADFAKNWDPDVWSAACSDILDALDAYDEEMISLELWNLIFSEMSLDSETLERVLSHCMTFIQP